MFQAWASAPLTGVLLAACLAALVRGGPVERRGAGLYVLAVLAVTVTRRLTGGGPDLAADLAFDAPLFAGLAALSWRSPRSWPVWAALLQALAIGVDLAGAVRPQTPRVAVTSALWAVGAAQVGVFALGVIRASSAYIPVALR